MSTTLEHAISKLESENVRLTSQRMAILEYLENHHIHPTAEEIYHGIKESFPGISVATVYNNLRLFTDLGFLKEMSYGIHLVVLILQLSHITMLFVKNVGKLPTFFILV